MDEHIADMPVTGTDFDFRQEIFDRPAVSFNDNFDGTVGQIRNLTGDIVIMRLFQCPVPEPDTLHDTFDDDSGTHE